MNKKGKQIPNELLRYTDKEDFIFTQIRGELIILFINYFTRVGAGKESYNCIFVKEQLYVGDVLKAVPLTYCIPIKNLDYYTHN